MTGTVLRRGIATVLVLCGTGLWAGYLDDQRMLARLAERVDGGPAASVREHFENDIHYAAHALHDPATPAELPAGLVRLYYRLNPLHPGPADVVRWGSDYRGQCGSHSRVVIALLAHRGIEARPLLILDGRGHSIHTVVEARVDGRWVVGDPTFDLVYHRRDGQLATREDLAADTSQFHAQVRDVPFYDPRYDYDDVALFNWKKLPVVLPAVRSALVRVMGADRVDDIQRPWVWMRPHAFYAVACFALAVALLLADAWWAGRNRRRAGARG